MSRSPSHSVRFALVLLALASFTACETRRTPPPERASAGGEVARMPNGNGSTGAAARMDTTTGADTAAARGATSDTTAHRTTGSTTSAAPAALTAPHIFAMFDDANSAEITAAGIAVEKASSGTVKNFATQLIRDHRALLHESRTLAERLQVTPQATSDSTLIKLERQMLDTLRTAPSGPSFDSLYMATQIRMHQKAIDAVRSAEQAAGQFQMRGLLQDALTTLESHLREAQRIQRGLSA